MPRTTYKASTSCIDMDVPHAAQPFDWRRELLSLRPQIENVLDMLKES
jgi:hypothetical protein